MTQCQAHSKRTGEPCRNAAVTGRRHCRMHGGKSPVGPALPQWKDGGRSKYLPKRLLDDYQASLDNPDKLLLDADIALIDSRLSDVLRRVDSGESGRIWTELREARRELEAARRIPDKDLRSAAIASAVNVMCELIDRGSHDSAAWAEVTGLIERRRKLVESERKRLVEAQQLVHVEQAAALLGLMVDAVRRHVRDDATLRAITNEYARLTGVSGDSAALPIEADVLSR